MATPTHQRVIIIILAVVMAVGTIGSFAALILANDNQVRDSERAQAEQEKMRQEYLAQNRPLDGYQAKPFEADSVSKLEVDVLKPGKGDIVAPDSRILANYFGWTSDGVIFDSTKRADAAPEPIEFSLDMVIDGWSKGLVGQKVGSTVQLTIPADQAYGSVDNGTGQPVGPLKFVVEIKDIVS